MFGGAGLYRDGLMFGLVADNEIYLKAGDDTAGRFREAGCRPFVYSSKGKSATMSYWSAPDAALDDPEVMRTWAELAWSTAKRKTATGKAATRKARPRKTKPPAKRAKR